MQYDRLNTKVMLSRVQNAANEAIENMSMGRPGADQQSTVEEAGRGTEVLHVVASTIQFRLVNIKCNLVPQ